MIQASRTDPNKPPDTSQALDKNSDSLNRQSIISRGVSRDPVRINADDQSKFTLLQYALAIVLPLVAVIIIAVVALPNATQRVQPYNSRTFTDLTSCTTLLYRPTINQQYLSCYPSSNFSLATTNSVGMHVGGLTNLNQFLLFYLDLSSYANAQPNLAQFKQIIGFSVYVAQYKPDISRTQITPTPISTTNISVSRNMKWLRRKKIFLGAQAKVTAGQQFYGQITLKSNSSITSPSQINLQVVIAVYTIRLDFTIYTILVRVVFFMLALVVFFRYASVLIKIPKNVVSIQQRCVWVIGVLTLFFNDQLFFVTVLWPNPVTSFLSALFIWNMFFGYFVLWVSFLVRIVEDEADNMTLSLKKPMRVCLQIVFYVCGLGYCSAYAIIQTQEHPAINPNSIDSPGFRFFFVTTIICFIIGIFYLIYLYTQVFRKRPQRSHRHNVFIYTSFFFIIGVVIVILLGSFQVFDYSGALIFFTFAFNNIYSYFLQYLYSPTQDQLRRYAQKEDMEYRLAHDPELLEIDEVDVQLDNAPADEWRDVKGKYNGRTVAKKVLAVQEELKQEEDNKDSSLRSRRSSRAKARTERIRKEMETKGMDQGETIDKIINEQEKLQNLQKPFNQQLNQQLSVNLG